MGDALRDKSLVPVYAMNSLYDLRESVMILCRPTVLKRCQHYDNLRKCFMSVISCFVMLLF